MRAGNDSPQIPPPTGAPAIVVPMGFTNGSSHAPLPTSLTVRPHVVSGQLGVMPSCAAFTALVDRLGGTLLHVRRNGLPVQREGAVVASEAVLSASSNAM